jgi:antitoxin (DNA-binding transcriptional repressor) of toxin-antitoxin stability system
MMTIMEVQDEDHGGRKIQLDEVQAKREPVLVTKNGKPVAKVVPIALEEEEDPIFGFYKGKIEIVGDIMAPIYSDEEYEQFYQEKLESLK